MREAAAQLKAPSRGRSHRRGPGARADLDNFRRVNVVIGHRAADTVLDEVATRVRKVAGLAPRRAPG